MPEIRFESNIREWTAALDDVVKRQVPFATARALTETARQDAKPAVERRIEVAFDRPNPFTRNSVGTLPARKGLVMIAWVFIKDRQQLYLNLQETGGVRLPQKKAVVVPVGIRRNQYGNMTRGAIGRLLQRDDVFSGQIRGVGGIWQRRKRGGPKLLVRFEPQTSYQPRFEFAKTVEEVARAAFPKRFEDALRAALATAR